MSRPELTTGELQRHAIFYVTLAKAGEPSAVVQQAMTAAFEMLDFAAGQAEEQGETIAEQTLSMAADLIRTLASIQAE